MADGTSKAIENVVVGDRVKGYRGVINTVTGLDRTVLGGRKLFSFNGGKNFVTAEHPLMTDEGWKSIDPEATKSENPALIVGRLKIGVRVAVRIRNNASPPPLNLVSSPPEPRNRGYEFRVISSIEGVPGAPEMPLYNLILDGNHSYHADGYVAHNK